MPPCAFSSVCGAPLIEIARPMTAGSAPKADVHSPWLRMTTGAGDGPSSAAVNARPRAGGTRMVEKKLAVARVALSGLASPWSSQLAWIWRKTVTSANACCVLRSSS